MGINGFKNSSPQSLGEHRTQLLGADNDPGSKGWADHGHQLECFVRGTDVPVSMWSELSGRWVRGPVVCKAGIAAAWEVEKELWKL